MASNEQKEIFKQGSTTYYLSSLFFPKKIRDDVFTLYAFVRVADDYVDNIPAQQKEFFVFVKETRRAYKTKQSSNHIIDSFIR